MAERGPSLRMFAAVVPPPEAIEDLDDFLEVRRASGPFRWTDPEHLHLTCAFYASVPERKLDDLIARLERAAKRRTAVTTRIAGGGAFPNPARAKVLWAGLDLDDRSRTELSRLATGCRAAGNRAGAPVDGKKRFSAHLTVARLGHPAEVSNWVKLLDAYAGPEWTVDTLTLVASYLGEGRRRRPRYETVAEFPLSARRT